MIAATAVVLWMSTVPAACPSQWEPRLQLGAGLSRASVTGSIDVSRVLGVAVAASLKRCLGYPVRAEVSFVTSTIGSSGGVEAVKVSSWTGELDLFASYQWPWVVRETARFGGELLLGPGLQITRSSIDLRGDDTVHFGVQLLAAAGVGIFLESVGWRIGFRATSAFPRERELRMLLGVGKIF